MTPPNEPENVVTAKEFGLNEDIVSELIQFLDFLDSISLLQISRMLYYSHGLWYSVLERRGSQHPLACSPETDIHALPFPKLRKLGFHTAALTKRWTGPRIVTRSWHTVLLKRRQVTKAQSIFAVVPGEAIVLAYEWSGMLGGLNVTAWDLHQSTGTAIELASHNWKKPLLSFGPSSDRFTRLYFVGAGRCRFAFLTGIYADNRQWLVVAELDYTNRHLVTLKQVLTIELIHTHVGLLHDISFYATLSESGVTIAATNHQSVICFGHIDIPVQSQEAESFPTELVLTPVLTHWDLGPSGRIRSLELVVRDKEVYVLLSDDYFMCHLHFPLKSISMHLSNAQYKRALTPLQQQRHETIRSFAPGYMVFIYSWRGDDTAYTRCSPMRIDPATKDLIFAQRQDPRNPSLGIKDEGYSCSNNVLISFSGRTIIHPKHPDWKPRKPLTSLTFTIAQCGYREQRTQAEICIPDDVSSAFTREIGKHAYVDDHLGLVMFQSEGKNEVYVLSYV